MRYSSLFPILIILLMLLSSAALPSSMGITPPLFLDFEEDDGDLIPSGEIDPWEWGVPGTGSVSAPGPGSAWSGSRCWGSPLNGTYPNGTDSALYLDLELAEDASGISVGFRSWYDLSSLVEDPTPDPASDRCTLEYSWDSETWTVLDTFTRTSSGEWVERGYEFPKPGAVRLMLRFHIQDLPDGRRGAGFFLDDLSVNTIPFSDDVITLSDIFIPEIVPVGLTFSIWCNVSCVPDRVPQDASIEMRALYNGNLVDTVTFAIVQTGYTDVMMSLTPDAVGPLTVELYKMIPGRSILALSKEIDVVEPMFHERFDADSENWVFPAMDDPSFYPFPDPIARTPSRGRVAGLATSLYDDLSIGFSGEMWAFMQTYEMDLRMVSSAVMYIYHEHSFMGPEGTCGGLVMAHFLNESRILSPERGYDSNLITGRSGSIGDARAFTGEKEWGVDVFNLSILKGRTGYVSFQATSGEEGVGEGWKIDDVMIVVGEDDANDDTPPSPVKGLIYDAQEGGIVTIGWDPSSEEDLDHYRLYLSTEPITDLTLLTPEVILEPSGEPGYVLLDLEPSRRYHVAVVAVDVWDNMNTRPASISFVTPQSSMNRPPVAAIRIEGSAELRVGEEIVLSASDSFDPDKDSMTFTWTMPDGSVRIGDRIRWTPEAPGEGRVMLQARDRWGATNETFIVIDISEGGSSLITRGNIYAFLIIILPAAIAMLIMIMIIAYLRGNRKRRLELDLEDVGIVHMPQYISAEPVERMPQATVLDLKPSRRRGSTGVPHRVDGERKAYAASRDVNDKRSSDGDAPAGTEVRRSAVNMTLECPSCMRKFRTRMEDPGAEGAKDIKCPHCGMQGTI